MEGLKLNLYLLFGGIVLLATGGLPHSIAGASETFSVLFHSKAPNYQGATISVVSAALGNLFRGTSSVGVLNYAHIKKMQ